MLSLPGAQVQSVFRELRFNKPHRAAIKKPPKNKPKKKVSFVGNGNPVGFFFCLFVLVSFQILLLIYFFCPDGNFGNMLRLYSLIKT